MGELNLTEGIEDLEGEKVRLLKDRVALFKRRTTQRNRIEFGLLNGHKTGKDEKSVKTSNEKILELNKQIKILENESSLQKSYYSKIPDGYVSFDHYMAKNKWVNNSKFWNMVYSNTIDAKTFFIKHGNDLRQIVCINEKDIHLLDQCMVSKNRIHHKWQTEIRFVKDLARKLKILGFDVRREVGISTGQRIDIVAIKGDQIIVIEAKAGNGSDHISSSLGQLICYRYEYNEAILVAAFTNYIKDKYFDIFIENGIQVITNIDELAY